MSAATVPSPATNEMRQAPGPSASSHQPAQPHGQRADLPPCHAPVFDRVIISHPNSHSLRSPLHPRPVCHHGPGQWLRSRAHPRRVEFDKALSSRVFNASFHTTSTRPYSSPPVPSPTWFSSASSSLATAYSPSSTCPGPPVHRGALNAPPHARLALIAFACIQAAIAGQPPQKPAAHGRLSLAGSQRRPTSKQAAQRRSCRPWAWATQNRHHRALHSTQPHRLAVSKFVRYPSSPAPPVRSSSSTGKSAPAP